MEALVAISIFSMSVVGVFAIFSDTILSGRVSGGLRGAVALSDAFLSSRKLNGDGLDYFFEPSLKQAIMQGRVAAVMDSLYRGQELVRTNRGVRYLLRLRARILQLNPFIYRAFLVCSWKEPIPGEERIRAYELSTVFVHEDQKGTNE